MITNRFYLLKWFLPLLLSTNVCFCNMENFNFFPIDIEQMIRSEFFIPKSNSTNATILSPIIQLNSNNWTSENQNCLRELNEIASGFNNDEKWAVKCMCLMANKLNRNLFFNILAESLKVLI